MKKLIVAMVVFAASTAWAQEKPSQPEEPESMCVPVDDADDSCDEVDARGDSLMSTQSFNECCSSCVHHSSGWTCVFVLHCNSSC